MDGLEKDLTALLAADAPPARDAAFALAVMARIERRRYRDELVSNAAMACLAALLLFALAAPVTELMQGVSANLATVLAVTILALWAMGWSLREMEV